MTVGQTRETPNGMQEGRVAVWSSTPTGMRFRRRFPSDRDRHRPMKRPRKGRESAVP